MKKKMIALLMVMAMSVSLVACGEDASVQSESTNDNTLTVWAWEPSFTFVALEEAERIYQENHPDFKLNIVETAPEDVQTKLTTAATSGNLDTLPDVLLLQDNSFQKNVLSFSDVFVDLTDSGIDFENLSEGKVGFSKADGKNYGVPFDNGTSVGAYRTDMLQQANLTIDDFTDITWSQFTENGKKVVEATGKPLITELAGEPDLVCQMLQSAGASMFKEDGSANIADNDVLYEAVEIYKELVDTGVLKRVNSTNEYRDSLTRGNAAGAVTGCWIIGSIQSAEDQAGKWGVTNIPKLEKAKNATNYASNGGSSWAIMSSSNKQDLAIDFMKTTFAGSIELWENILPTTGAMTTYLPVGDSEVYSAPQEFFGGEPIYKKITEYAAEVPSNITGMYYFDARDAVASALSNIINGGDIKEELQKAEDTLNFNMGK